MLSQFNWQTYGKPDYCASETHHHLLSAYDTVSIVVLGNVVHSPSGSMLLMLTCLYTIASFNNPLMVVRILGFKSSTIPYI